MMHDAPHTASANGSQAYQVSPTASSPSGSNDANDKFFSFIFTLGASVAIAFSTHKSFLVSRWFMKENLDMQGSVLKIFAGLPVRLGLDYDTGFCSGIFSVFAMFSGSSLKDWFREGIHSIASPVGRCNTIRGFLKIYLGYPSVILTAATLASSVRTQVCPDYTSYSQVPHGPASVGPLALPYMRPSPACRTFSSSAVEKVITDMKSLIKDPDIARLFENTFPNTLDTTVKYFSKEENLAFIITGDITAQWLRDTANQFAHYRSLFVVDHELASLVKAVINNEARYIAQFPYCGAFQPPPESGLPPSHNAWADGITVYPPVDNKTVFECKYELDSLCGFLKLSRSYYGSTNDTSFMNPSWRAAIDQVFRVINEQAQATFDGNYNFISYYNWTGGNGALSPMVNNRGNGEPKAYTGLVGTHHRPSDDLSVFAFLTPANAMLSVELKNLANVLDSAGVLPNVSQQAKEWSSRIHDAIWETTVVDHIFAYETNGFGGRYVMDDANVPSLLSLPYLGFMDKGHPAYVSTRKLMLSRNNPYYAAGGVFNGVGGPHVDPWHPWPMSHISAIFGTDNDQEILESLYIIANNTSGLGLIHESQSIHESTSYTRSWFAWANSYFAEMILDLADRKPELILKQNKSYKPGQQQYE